MTTAASLPCFHSDSLRQAFVRQLTRARTTGELATAEIDALQQLCAHPWQSPPALRVDQLTANGWHSPEFADALMISYTDNDPSEVYLCLPLQAVERFADRHSLDQALIKRYAQGTDLNISAQRLETSPFAYWMAGWLSRQQTCLQRLDANLLKLPSLRSVMHEALTETLTRLSPIAETDPDHWVYQVTARTARTPVLHTVGLVETTLDEFCAAPGLQDSRRWLMAADGRALSAQENADYNEAFRTCASHLNNHYELALERYWQSADAVDYKTLATRALRQGYYLAIMRGAQLGTLDSVSITWLRAALHPGLQGTADTPLRAHRIELHSGVRPGLSLAGIFALTDSNPTNQQLYLYAPRLGLRLFENRPALAAWLTGDALTPNHPQTLLHEAIGLDNRAALTAMKRPQLRLVALEGDIFSDRTTSILQLQRRNLSVAIAQRGTDRDAVAAALDDALDVRGLLAPALLSLRHSPRWAPAVERPALPDAVQPATAHPTSPLRAKWQQIHDAQPSLRNCMEYLTDLQLAVLDQTDLTAENLWITHGGTQAGTHAGNEAGTHAGTQAESSTKGVIENLPSGGHTLMSHGLDQLRATPALALPPVCVVMDNALQPIGSLDVLLLDHLLAQVRTTASSHWIRRFNRFNSQPTRCGNTQIDAHRQSLMIRQHALRAELLMPVSSAADNDWAHDWLRQVLDRPTRAMRLPLGDEQVEVKQLSVRLSSNAFAIPLSNVMTLTQAVQPSGKIALCSHLWGIITFASEAHLKRQLLQFMRTRDAHPLWLGLVADRFSSALAAGLQSASTNALNLELAPVDGDYAQYLQRSDETRQTITAEVAFSRARKAHYGGELMADTVDDSASRLMLVDQLDEQANAARGAELERKMPRWLRDATDGDLRLYQQNLDRVRATLSMPRQYLFGVKSAQEFASEELWTSLELDFPTEGIDPGKIRVQVAQRFTSSLHFSAASESMITSSTGIAYPVADMSLIEYSLQRAIAAPGIPIKLSGTDDLPLSDSITPEYVTRLVDRLDTGGHYLRQLGQLFSPHHAQYAQRQALFHEQIPPALMDVAIECKLKGELSERGYRIVESILQMPDSLARQSPESTPCSIRPLGLLAAEHLAVDEVAGLYLLGAQAGPVVLLATYHSAFIFREFVDEAELLARMRAPGDLQDLILQRVDTGRYARYSDGGLTTPHFDISASGPFEHPLHAARQTRISAAPVAGNAVTYLFDQSLKFLLRLARSQVVTSEQADRAATASLLILLVETGLTFANGRIALAQSVWQSAEWLLSSAKAISARQWGPAAAEFSAALFGLLGHRRPRRERSKAEPERADEFQLADPVFSWRFNELPATLRARLQALEVQDLALNALTPDTASGVYLQPSTGKRYAAVAGKVFEVRKLEGTWTIVGTNREGPPLRRNGLGHWELAISQGLRGGNPLTPTHPSTQRLAEQVFITDAAGMPQITARYWAKAVEISLAKSRATRYLNTCLDALTIPAGQSDIPADSVTVLEGFFGIKTPSTALIDEVRTMTGQILSELTDASLDSHTSARFVCGRNKPGHEGTVAFTDPDDTQRRIFLTEVFFRGLSVFQTALHPDWRQFDVGMHFRATTLIHEMSHIVNHTEDLAYIEAAAPFTDMIDATRSGNQALIKTIKAAREQTLALMAPDTALFTIEENGVCRDLTSADGEAYDLILQHSGTTTLADARAAFRTQDGVRRKIMLANADSVALLITLLARTLD